MADGGYSAWDQLPREILATIFSNFSQIELVAIVSAVCREWRRCVFVPELWPAIGPGLGPFPWRAVEGVVRRLGKESKRVTVLDLSECGDVPSTAEGLACLAGMAVSTVVVAVDRAEPVQVEAAVALLRVCPGVDALALWAPPKLCFGFPVSALVPLEPLLSACGRDGATPPLSLAHLRSLTMGQGSRVDASEAGELVRACPRLERLHMTLSMERQEAGDALVDALTASCRQLTELEVDAYDTGLSDAACVQLLDVASVTHMAIRRCLVPDAALSTAILARFTHLALASDGLVRPLVAAARLLRSLHLSSYKLEAVHVSECDVLSKLEIEGDPANRLVVHVEACPQLNEVTVRRATCWELRGEVTRVRTLRVPSLTTDRVEHLPKGLVELHIQGSENRPASATHGALAAALAWCSSLKVVTVDGLDCSAVPAAGEAVINARALEEVDVKVALKGFFAPLPKLKVSSPRLRLVRLRGYGSETHLCEIESGRSTVDLSFPPLM